MRNKTGAEYAASKYNELTVREETTLLEFLIKAMSLTRNRAKDILTGRYYDLSSDLTLKPRQSLILDYQQDLSE